MSVTTVDQSGLNLIQINLEFKSVTRFSCFSMILKLPYILQVLFDCVVFTQLTLFASTDLVKKR